MNRSNRSNPVCRVLLAITVAVTTACGSTAPPLDAAPDVDLSRFSGKWYEIAKLPRMTESDCNGTTAFYTQQADGSLGLVNQCNLGSATGPLHTVAMSATIPDPTAPGKLALDVGGFTGDYWILEVGPDYEYAVVGHPSRLYWWVLSRTPTLDSDTMQGVLARATASDFDVSQVEYTPQPPGSERQALETPEGPIPAPLKTGCSASGGAASGRRGPPQAGLPWLALGLAAIALRASRRRAG